MKKMMLLASVVGLVALMLAAAPAFAQSDRACDPGNASFCDRDNDNDGDDGDDDGDDNDNDNDRDVFRNLDFGNVEVSPTIDISQETEQDCDTGEVSQPIDVNSGGDNSITTVGLQPTANTGCAQNATGVLQAAPIVAGFGGDTVINNEDNNVFNNDEDNNDNDRCDRDHDGNKDRDCEDADNNDDNGDNGVDFNNRTLNRIGGDRNTINGADFGDVDVDSNSSIDVSPSQVVNGG